MSSFHRDRLAHILNHLRPNGVALHTSNETTFVKQYPCALDASLSVIELNYPPVNALHPNVLAALDTAIKHVRNSASIRGCIITGQKRFFCGGADIGVLQKIANGEKAPALAEIAHPILNNLENSDKPFIAAVNGFALGGGCELAMACHYRIGLPQTKIGLVEAGLGLIPGFGGTQRLPRLIGFGEAANAIIGGISFKADAAKQKGLLDELCNNKDELMKRSVIIANEMIDGKRKIVRTLYRTDKLPDKETGMQQIEAMKRRFSKWLQIRPGGHFALRTMEGLFCEDPNKGLDVELHEFNEIIKTHPAKSQLHLFFSERNTLKQIPYFSQKQVLTQANGKLKSFLNIGVIGGGLMGCGIGALSLSKGLNVYMFEINQTQLDLCKKKILSIMKKTFKFDENKLNKVMNKISFHVMNETTYQSIFNKLDLVIEAVIENINVKREIFENLDKYCNNNCILASNTSTIEIDKLMPEKSNNINSKDRIFGLHFFSPADRMQLVEIINLSDVTSMNNFQRNENLALLSLFSKNVLKKIPVIVGNCRGFVANRMFFPYVQSCMFLIEHGMCPYKMDRILENSDILGMPIGICKMLDAAGIDIFYKINCLFNDPNCEYYARCYQSLSFFEKLMKLNRLGKKTGKGIYKYDLKNRNVLEDSNDINKILNECRQNRLQLSFNNFNDSEIMEMLLFPCVNEAFIILSETNICFKPSDIDIISVFGYGFPRKQGGLLFWAKNKCNLQYIVHKLESFSRLSNDKNANMFFKPSIQLKKAAGM